MTEGLLLHIAHVTGYLCYTLPTVMKKALSLVSRAITKLMKLLLAKFTPSGPSAPVPRCLRCLSRWALYTERGPARGWGDLQTGNWMIRRNINCCTSIPEPLTVKHVH